jgi:hypothetical protein
MLTWLTYVDHRIEPGRRLAPPSPPMTELASRIDMLDTSLFDALPDELTEWDRRALLGLHAAVAAKWLSFTYLEIGSYLGGSLQIMIRDPRCEAIVSVDPRFEVVPDKRVPYWSYEGNSTANMMQRLSTVDDAAMHKLHTLEVGSESVRQAELPVRPDFCFIDGEHTDEAVLRDAELCMSAIDGDGVIAFHDYPLVEPGIRSFLRAHWRDISMALAFTGLVFAVEVGNRGALRSEVVQSAISSRWHSVAWRTANVWRASPLPLFWVWQAMPRADALIALVRQRLARPRQDPLQD